MPIWKYRSVNEMPPPPSYESGSEAHFRRWAALWARSARMARKRFPSGVFRFHGVEDPHRADFRGDSSRW